MEPVAVREPEGEGEGETVPLRFVGVGPVVAEALVGPPGVSRSADAARPSGSADRLPTVASSAHAVARAAATRLRRRYQGRGSCPASPGNGPLTMASSDGGPPARGDSPAVPVTAEPVTHGLGAGPLGSSGAVSGAVSAAVAGALTRPEAAGAARRSEAAPAPGSRAASGRPSAVPPSTGAAAAAPEAELESGPESGPESDPVPEPRAGVGGGPGA